MAGRVSQYFHTNQINVRPTLVEIGGMKIRQPGHLTTFRKGIAASILLACFYSQSVLSNPLLPVSDNLDLQRFMGRWYVIASIPTPFETQAYNATEDYERLPSGDVATTFSYNKGALDGPFKVSKPTGFVSVEHDAIWKMQFLWPFKADYRVAFVDEAHKVTIVGREKRDYVWLMARRSDMAEQEYSQYVGQIASYGYDVSKLRRVPHSSGTASSGR